VEKWKGGRVEGWKGETQFITVAADVSSAAAIYIS